LLNIFLKTGKNTTKARRKHLMQLRVKHQILLNSMTPLDLPNDFVGRPLGALRGWPRPWSYQSIWRSPGSSVNFFKPGPRFLYLLHTCTFFFVHVDLLSEARIALFHLFLGFMAFFWHF
jgi:hypothetical protein